MKNQVILACLILTAVSAFAQSATLQFRREGNNLIVTQNGTDKTVPASSDNDFVVPVPGPSPAPQPSPVAPSTPTITPAPASPAPVATTKKTERPRVSKTVAVPPDAAETSTLQYAPQPVGHGGGVIISPSALPNDTVPTLPSSDLTASTGTEPGGGALYLGRTPAPTSAGSPLSAAERRELNLYRAMLASPLRLTVENGAVTVKWNSAHGTVAIPDSHQIDIRLDRVIQPH